MATVNLKINIVERNTLKIFPASKESKVDEVIAAIGVDNGSPKDYGLYLATQKKWIREKCKILDLNEQDVFDYKKKIISVKVKNLDHMVCSVSIDESLTVSDIVCSICKTFGLSDYHDYSLCVEGDKNTVRWLVSDQVFTDQNVNDGEILSLRKLSYITNENDSLNQVQLNLDYSQCRTAIVTGRQPCNLQESIRLAALQLQEMYGDSRDTGELNCSKLLPPEYARVPKVEERIMEEWKTIDKNSNTRAKNMYVQLCKSLPTYGVTFFLVKENHGALLAKVPFLLGLTSRSIMLLNYETKEVINNWPLHSLRRWIVNKRNIVFEFEEKSEGVVYETTEGESISQLLNVHFEIIVKKKKLNDALFKITGSENDKTPSLTNSNVRANMYGKRDQKSVIIETLFFGMNFLEKFNFSFDVIRKQSSFQEDQKFLNQIISVQLASFLLAISIINSQLNLDAMERDVEEFCGAISILSQNMLPLVSNLVIASEEIVINQKDLELKLTALTSNIHFFLETAKFRLEGVDENKSEDSSSLLIEIGILIQWIAESFKVERLTGDAKQQISNCSKMISDSLYVFDTLTQKHLLEALGNENYESFVSKLKQAKALMQQTANEIKLLCPFVILNTCKVRLLENHVAMKLTMDDLLLILADCQSKSPKKEEIVLQIKTFNAMIAKNSSILDLVGINTSTIESKLNDSFEKLSSIIKKTISSIDDPVSVTQLSDSVSEILPKTIFALKELMLSHTDPEGNRSIEGYSDRLTDVVEDMCHAAKLYSENFNNEEYRISLEESAQIVTYSIEATAALSSRESLMKELNKKVENLMLSSYCLHISLEICPLHKLDQVWKTRIKEFRTEVIDISRGLYFFLKNISRNSQSKTLSVIGAIVTNLPSLLTSIKSTSSYVTDFAAQAQLDMMISRVEHDTVSVKNLFSSVLRIVTDIAIDSAISRFSGIKSDISAKMLVQDEPVNVGDSVNRCNTNNLQEQYEKIIICVMKITSLVAQKDLMEIGSTSIELENSIEACCNHLKTATADEDTKKGLQDGIISIADNSVYLMKQIRRAMALHEKTSRDRVLVEAVNTFEKVLNHALDFIPGRHELAEAIEEAEEYLTDLNDNLNEDSALEILAGNNFKLAADDLKKAASKVCSSVDYRKDQLSSFLQVLMEKYHALMKIFSSFITKFPTEDKEQLKISMKNTAESCIRLLLECKKIVLEDKKHSFHESVDLQFQYLVHTLSIASSTIYKVFPESVSTSITSLLSTAPKDINNDGEESKQERISSENIEAESGQKVPDPDVMIKINSEEQKKSMENGLADDLSKDKQDIQRLITAIKIYVLNNMPIVISDEQFDQLKITLSNFVEEITVMVRRIKLTNEGKQDEITVIQNNVAEIPPALEGYRNGTIEGKKDFIISAAQRLVLFLMTLDTIISPSKTILKGPELTSMRRKSNVLAAPIAKTLPKRLRSEGGGIHDFIMTSKEELYIATKLLATTAESMNELSIKEDKSISGARRRSNSANLLQSKPPKNDDNSGVIAGSDGDMSDFEIDIPKPLVTFSEQPKFRKKLNSENRISTLKRQQLRSRSASEGENGNLRRKSFSEELLNQDMMDPKKVALLRVTVPEKMTTTMIKFPLDYSMESLLKFLASKKKFDFSNHTLAIPGKIKEVKSPLKKASSWFIGAILGPNNASDSSIENEETDDQNLVDVELDRSVQYYMETHDMKEVIVITAEKSFGAISVNEDKKDVMLLKIVRGKTMVMAGLPEKLIERMTDNQESGNEYMDTLLLTFRNFMTPEELLDTLCDRYPFDFKNPTDEDLIYYNANKLPTQIRSRTVETINWWLEYHYHDFVLNVQLLQKLVDFIFHVKESGEAFQSKCDRLLDLVEIQKEKRLEIMELQEKTTERKSKVMQSIFADVDPTQMAQQMSLYNYKLFRAVHPIEFLNAVWLPPKPKKKDDDFIDPMPNLNFFIKRFDMESYWVATEVCSEKDLKKRTKILKNFISITKTLLEIKNFFSLVSILGGLNLQPVKRLKKTWEALPASSRQTFEEMEKVIDPSRNMKNLRDALNSVKPPFIPFLAIYLKDLTFMNDGNPSRTEDNLINFEKLRMMGKRVLEITSITSTEYYFKEIPAVQNYLRKPMVEMNISKLKESSLQCEPN